MREKFVEKMLSSKKGFIYYTLLPIMALSLIAVDISKLSLKK